MELFEEKLKKAGLTGNEAKVYLELLKKGELSANQLAKNISMDRTLTYTVLNNLIEKGMVNYVVRDNLKIFISAEPENLLNPVRSKEIFISDLIVELSKLKQKRDEAYEIKVYEGKEGFRTYFRNVLGELPDELCSYGGTGRGYDLLYEFPRLAKEYSSKVKRIRQIMNLKYKEHRFLKDVRGVEFRYLDIKSNATVSVFNDKVSIHLINDKPIVIYIRSKEIARSFKEHFEVLWSVARKE